MKKSSRKGGFFVVRSEYLPGELQLLLWGKAFVKFINVSLVDVIAARSLINSRYAVEIPKFKLFAQKERVVGAIGQIVIPYAEISGIVKSALAVKTDVAFKKHGSKAHFRRLFLE